MMQKLTRRRFGQLAIAGTAGAALSTLASKTFAQPSLVICGVSTNYGASTATASPAGRLVMQYLDVTRGLVFDKTTGLVSNQNPPLLKPRERLTGLSYLSDGTLVLSSNSTKTDGKKTKTTTIKFIGSSLKELIVLGLAAQTIESLLVTNDGSLLALVGQSNGAPPFKLANIDRNTGQISFLNFTLPANQRFNTLAQCPDGKIYATAIGRLSDTSLVNLDPKRGELRNLAELNVKGKVWDNGLRSLACSPAGQLFALGAPRYETTNSVYTIEPHTGDMTLLREFDVNNIAFPPA